MQTTQKSRSSRAFKALQNTVGGAMAYVKVRAPIVGDEAKERVRQMGQLMPKKYPSLKQGTGEFIRKYNEESENIKKARKFR